MNWALRLVCSIAMASINEEGDMALKPIFASFYQARNKVFDYSICAFCI